MRVHSGLFVAATVAAQVSAAASQEVTWPENYVIAVDEAAAGILTPSDYDDFYRRALGATLDLAVEQDLPGAVLLQFIASVEADGAAALTFMDRADARLRISAGEPGYDAPRSAAAVAILGLERLHSSGAGLPESAATLAAQIGAIEDALAAAGVPGLRDALLSAAGERAEEVISFLDWLQASHDLTDAEALAAFYDRVEGALPASFAAPLSGQVVVFRAHQEWVREMTDVSSDTLDAVGEIIRTGVVDQARLDRNTAALNRLRRGPWGPDTVRSYVSRWCELLPVSGDFCTWALTAWDDDAPEDMCSTAIDCDCVHSDYWGDIGRNQCLGYESSARDACRQSGSVLTGFCDPVTSGPAHYP